MQAVNISDPDVATATAKADTSEFCHIACVKPYQNATADGPKESMTILNGIILFQPSTQLLTKGKIS